MSKAKIALITVGSLSRRLNVGYLQSWPSELIEFRHSAGISHTPDSAGPGWTYPDTQFKKLIRPDPECLFTIALVNAPLEFNYYSRRLPSNLVVLSLFEIDSILRAANTRIEHFVLRAAYAHLIYCQLFEGKIPVTGNATLSHQEVKGCLFDLNVDKSDTVASLNSPILCEVCKARFTAAQVPPRFVPTLEREIRLIRKDLFFRASEWVQAHPILSLTIAGTAAFLINILSNAVYDLAKSLLTKAA